MDNKCNWFLGLSGSEVAHSSEEIALFSALTDDVN